MDVDEFSGEDKQQTAQEQRQKFRVIVQAQREQKMKLLDEAKRMRQYNLSLQK